jgi:hypothetical protein
MGNIQKITKLKLKITQDNEFILFGLVSSEPDYKLSSTINKKFRISLKNTTPVKVIDDSGSELAFSRFSDTSDSTGKAYNLFSNRSGKYFLLKKLKNVDYIFQLNDPENEDNADFITAGLKEIESVNAVFTIDLKTFRDKNLKYLTH